MTKSVKFKLFINDMGSYETVVTASASETLMENLLWDINSAREHDGLRPLSRVPKSSILSEEPL